MDKTKKTTKPAAATKTAPKALKTPAAPPVTKTLETPRARVRLETENLPFNVACAEGYVARLCDELEKDTRNQLAQSAVFHFRQGLASLTRLRVIAENPMPPVGNLQS